MTAQAAFRCCYSDFKLIKTRGVVSISFEVPVEQAQTVLDVLGGMPVAASEVWCAVARLTEDGGGLSLSRATHTDIAPGPEPTGGNHAAVGLKPTMPRQEPSTPDGAKTKTAFRDMRPANQAGILCAEVPFQRFLAERFEATVLSPDCAAAVVRGHCNVASRKDIRPRTPSGDRWQRLVDEYRTWMHAPEYADAS